MSRMIEQDLPMTVPVNRRRLTRRKQKAVYRAVSIALGFDQDKLSGAELMTLTDAREKIQPLKRRRRNRGICPQNAQNDTKEIANCREV